MSEGKDITLTLRRDDTSIRLKIPGVKHDNGEQFYAYLLPCKARKSLTAAIKEARDYYKGTRTDSIGELVDSYLTEVLEVLEVREYIEENQS